MKTVSDIGSILWKERICILLIVLIFTFFFKNTSPKVEVEGGIEYRGMEKLLSNNNNQLKIDLEELISKTTINVNIKTIAGDDLEFAGDSTDILSGNGVKFGKKSKGVFSPLQINWGYVTPTSK